MLLQGIDPGDVFAMLPAGTQMWLNYINLISIAGLFFIRMREAQILVPAFVLSIPLAVYVVGKVGVFHPLTGVGHVVFWLPAAVYVGYRVFRKGWSEYPGWYRRAGAAWALLVVATYLVSNVWDVLNLVRFFILQDPGPRI